MDSKIHVRVTLDVFVVAESDIDVATRLREDCEFKVVNEADVMDIQDISVVDAVVDDSR